MPPRAPVPTRLSWGAALLLAACATRDVPASYPESSAASPKAPAAPALQVTQALAGDPPPPGATAAGWHGLDAQRADGGAVDPHARHRGHQHAQ